MNPIAKYTGIAALTAGSLSTGATLLPDEAYAATAARTPTAQPSYVGKTVDGVISGLKTAGGFAYEHKGKFAGLALLISLYLFHNMGRKIKQHEKEIKPAPRTGPTTVDQDWDELLKGAR